MIEPQDFLDTAFSFLKDEHEVAYRNAMSRGYYAFFHTCQHVIDRKKLQDIPSTSHDKVVKALQNDSNKNLKALGNALNRARADRVKA